MNKALKIASWNVNSLKVRIDQVLELLQSSELDVLALQETKLTDPNFPLQAFHDLGFHVVFSGQKTYNGVAVISREPLHDVITDVPNLIDPQRRILATTIGNLRIINLYVPNGSEVNSEKYLYKLDWLEKVTTFIHQQMQQYPDVIVLGDFNIAPDDRDVHDPLAWEGCVLVSPAERAALADLLALGLHDSFRLFTQPEQQFSWWDYRAAAFRRNRGLRIDLILLTHSLQSQCLESQINVIPRHDERPSDHAPVWVSLRQNFDEKSNMY
ncbi:MAG: exodeoxyribonuclease III [Legionellaceae bacterium]|nr:exodeoxyribonuclease III [Legionellaceae bacterium]